ncbi:MAG: hypothetical protein ACKVPX_07265 [Myxococcaceae bacterium]
MLALVTLASCRFSVNPDGNSFSCVDADDCDEGYECVARLDGTPSRCWPIGFCQPETCDGADQDCDGIVDDGFDLQSNTSHCGQCGNACPIGLLCQAGVCGNAG